VLKLQAYYAAKAITPYSEDSAMALLGRDTLIIGPTAAGPLLLETLQGTETLGIPYRYDLTLLEDDALTALRALRAFEIAHGTLEIA